MEYDKEINEFWGQDSIKEIDAYAAKWTDAIKVLRKMLKDESQNIYEIHRDYIDGKIDAKEYSKRIALPTGLLGLLPDILCDLQKTVEDMRQKNAKSFTLVAEYNPEFKPVCDLLCSKMGIEPEKKKSRFNFWK